MNGATWRWNPFPAINGATLRWSAFLASLAVLAYIATSNGTSWEWMLRSVAVGFAGGLAGGLIAGAIGLISVPLITLLLGLPIHQAVATNLFQTIFTAASGARTHHRLGNVNHHLAVPLLIGGLVGAPFGAWTSISLPEGVLRWLFVIILLAMVINLVRLLTIGKPKGTPWWHRSLQRLEDAQTKHNNWFTSDVKGTFRGHTYQVPRYLLLVFGTAIGFVSGLLGIGGGFLVTPLISTLLNVPTHLAVGSGLLVISGNSLFGTIPQLLKGNVLIITGLLLSAGGMIGARIGSRISHHLNERVLLAAFAAILLIVAWQMAP
jgi:uncharacterized protein